MKPKEKNGFGKNKTQKGKSGREGRVKAKENNVRARDRATDGAEEERGDGRRWVGEVEGG